MKKVAKLLVVSLLSMVFVFASAALATSETKISTHLFEEGNTDYSIQFQDEVKFQRIQGGDEEFGAIDVVAVVLKTPEFDSPIGLGKLEYTFRTNNPDANRLALSFESYFGGQVGVADAVDVIDGSYSSFINISSTTAKEDIIFVRAGVYDLNSDEGSRLLFNEKGVNFIFDSFAREGFTRTDLDISEQTMFPIYVPTVDSGYKLNFPTVSAKVQNVSGVDEEIGEFAVDVFALSDSPTLKEDSYVFMFNLETTNAEAYSVDLAINSYFGGQLEYLEQARFEDGKVSVYMYNGSHDSLASILENHVLNVDFIIYNTEGQAIAHYDHVNIKYNEFNRYKVVDPDHNTTEPIRAKPTTSKVLVNGEDVSFQAYNISGNNYFKLRDLAMVLSGTEKSFEVGWDAVRNLITLESGKAYTAVGGELVVSEKPEIEKGRLSTSAILLDGKTVELTAYLIKGNNYFKLRDVADVLDFGVTWDGETRTIGIDSSTSYVPE